MNVGELVVTFDVDASGAERGVAQAELALAGLQRSSDGRLRDLRGRFASESLLLGQSISDGVQAGTQAVAQHAEEAGQAVAHGLGDGGQDGSRRLVSSMSDAELAVAGFTRGSDGRLRDLRGRFVSESQTIGEALAEHVGGGAERAATRVEESGRRVSHELGRGGDDGDHLGRILSGIGDAAGPIGSVAGRLGMVAGAVGSAVPLVAGLSAALVAIAPAAGIAATGLLMVASAGAAIKIGSSGVGGALKAAFADAPAAAGAAAGAAHQVADAQRAVADASDNAAYANKQAAQRVVDAQRSVGDAVQAAADAQEQAARQVASAQRSVGDAVQAASDAQVQAARQVTSAERSLADAQKASLQAQQDLNDARAEAARDLEDLSNQVEDASLGQRSAVMRLAQAKQDLDRVMANPIADDSARAQAQLAFDQASQSLKEQQLSYDRLKAKAAEANAAGVDGSAKVVSAQDRLTAAQRTVSDQTQALADAQVAAQKRVESAERELGDRRQALADAQIAAQKRVASADREVEDRTRALADAQEQQARTAKQGAESVQKALEALQQAGAGGGGGGGVDPLAAALAKLSPNARAFVEEIIRLKPALADLKFDVQQRLFEGLDLAFRSTATSTLPVLHGALVTSAGHLNEMAQGVLSTAGHLAENGTLGQALASANKGLGSLSGLPSTIVQGLLQVGAAAGPAFERINAAAGGGIAKLSERMDAAFASGGMQRAIEQAVALIGQLGRILGNVGDIIGSVFGAAQQTGAGFLGTLEKVTAAMAAAFDSPAVKAALQALFQTMSLLASTVAPLLGQALQALGPVISALAPGVQALIAALGPALSQIIGALGPVLLAAAQAVSALAIAAAPLLTILGQLITAALPILTPLLEGASVIFQQLTPLVSALSVVIGSTLSPILGALPLLLTPFVTLLTTLTGALLPPLTQLIQQLPLPQLAQSFVQIATALAPVLTQLALLVGQLLTALMPILTPVINLATRLAAVFAGEVGQAITAVLVPALRMIGQILSGDFSGAIGSAKQLLSGLVSTVVGLFTSLPGQVLGALGDFGSQLWNAGARIIGSLVDGIKSKASAVVNGVKDILSSARNLLPFSPAREGPFSGSGWTFYSGQSISRALADGILGGQGQVRAAATSLMSAAHGPLDGALGLGGAGFGGPQLAMAGGGFGAGSGAAGGLQIQNYYESETGSARATAEELAWMAKGRG